MVESTLTKDMIETGAALIQKLDERGLQLRGALWFFFPDIGRWKLVIAEENVGKTGPRGIYQKIQQGSALAHQDNSQLDD